jgi:hypothetical protein
VNRFRMARSVPATIWKPICATCSPVSSPAIRSAASMSCCPLPTQSQRPTGQRPNNSAYVLQTVQAYRSCQAPVGGIGSPWCDWFVGKPYLPALGISFAEYTVVSPRRLTGNACFRPQSALDATITAGPRTWRRCATVNGWSISKRPFGAQVRATASLTCPCHSFRRLVPAAASSSSAIRRPWLPW